VESGFGAQEGTSRSIADIETSVSTEEEEKDYIQLYYINMASDTTRNENSQSQFQALKMNVTRYDAITHTSPLFVKSRELLCRNGPETSGMPVICREDYDVWPGFNINDFASTLSQFTLIQKAYREYKEQCAPGKCGTAIAVIIEDDVQLKETAPYWAKLLCSIKPTHKECPISQSTSLVRILSLLISHTTPKDWAFTNLAPMFPSHKQKTWMQGQGHQHWSRNAYGAGMQALNLNSPCVAELAAEDQDNLAKVASDLRANSIAADVLPASYMKRCNGQSVWESLLPLGLISQKDEETNPAMPTSSMGHDNSLHRKVALDHIKRWKATASALDFPWRR
jgi:hypothetical protein